jgi:hypothetical protein
VHGGDGRGGDDGRGRSLPPRVVKTRRRRLINTSFIVTVYGTVLVIIGLAHVLDLIFISEMLSSTV